MYLPKKLEGTQQIQKPIFFLAVEFEKDQTLLANYQLRTLPTMLFSDSHEIYIVDGYQRKQYLDKNLWRLTKEDGVINEFVINKWLGRTSGQDIKIKQSIFQYLLIMGSLLLLLSFLTLLYFYF